MAAVKASCRLASSSERRKCWAAAALVRWPPHTSPPPRPQQHLRAALAAPSRAPAVSPSRQHTLSLIIFAPPPITEHTHADPRLASPAAHLPHPDPAPAPVLRCFHTCCCLVGRCRRCPSCTRRRGGERGACVPAAPGVWAEKGRRAASSEGRRTRQTGAGLEGSAGNAGVRRESGQRRDRAACEWAVRAVAGQPPVTRALNEANSPGSC